MADYDVVGYIVKKREPSNAEGCVGCLVAIVLLTGIGSCIFEKRKSSPLPADNAINRQVGVTQAAQVSCRNCSGHGVKDVWTICPICNGHRKVVDQAKTAQSAMRKVANGLKKGRVPRAKTYYMTCPSCKGKGKIPRQERCGQCGGNGFLLKR